MEKLFPNLSTTYKKICSVWPPRPLKPVCRLHQSKEVCATETIHSNTLSKHTRASWAAPNLSDEGLEHTAGLQPSVPSTPQSTREGSRKGRGQCRALQKPFVSRPVTREEEKWQSCSALEALEASSFLTLELQNTHSGTTGCSNPVASVSEATALLPSSFPP